MNSIGKAAFLIAPLGVLAALYATEPRPEAKVLDLVKGYSKWKKANPKPVRLSISLDALCRGISAEEMKEIRSQNPHAARCLTVYVNKIGETAMMKGEKFPVGSVIVKEKREWDYAWKPDGKVLMSTVMIKREKGYNPSCGDWEFAAINANATKTDGEGKLESCMKCHKDIGAKKDFVFRSYVGAKEWGSPSGKDYHNFKGG